MPPAQPHAAILASPACIDRLDLLFFRQQYCSSLLVVENPYRLGTNLIMPYLPSLAALRTDGIIALVATPLGKA
jgi:hypothetical protein